MDLKLEVVVVPGSDVVTDIEAARAELVGRGADVSETFHDAGGTPHVCRAGEQPWM